MTVVVDIQGFKISDKDFSPKELAVYDGRQLSHYIFRAPFPFNKLPGHLQNQATWLMHNHHCIDWNEGFTPVFLFPKIIKRLLRDADKVYVKGKEKAQYLQNFTSKTIIECDLQPSLNMTSPSCIYHLQSVCICALSNVYHLYQSQVME